MLICDCLEDKVKTISNKAHSNYYFLETLFIQHKSRIIRQMIYLLN